MDSSNKEKLYSNKIFGLFFFVVFFLLALWPLKSGEDLRFWSLFISLIFLILGLLNSKLLSPLKKIWNYFGTILGLVISPIVMGLIFFVVITPIGMLMRIMSKDLLRLKMHKNTNSYWIKREKIKSTMKNQF